MKGVILIDADSGSLRYVLWCAVVVFVTSQTLLFRLALTKLCSRCNSTIPEVFDEFSHLFICFGVKLSHWRASTMQMYRMHATLGTKWFWVRCTLMGQAELSQYMFCFPRIHSRINTICFWLLVIAYFHCSWN